MALRDEVHTTKLARRRRYSCWEKRLEISGESRRNLGNGGECCVSVRMLKAVSYKALRTFPVILRKCLELITNQLLYLLS